MASSEPLSLSQVLSETRRIIQLQQRHFQTLTLLFLFPLSLSFLLYLNLHKKIQPYNLQLQESSINFNQYFLLPVLYTLVSGLFSSFAAASISSSAYRVSRNEPVDLISSLKSTFHSFWPLVSTSLVTGLIIGVFVTTPFLLLATLVSKWLQNSSYFIPVTVLIGLIFVSVVIYLQAKWMFALVVVVVESEWGYAPLERSAYLVKGNRRIVLLVLLYFEIVTMTIFSNFCVSSWLGGWWLLLLILAGSFTLISPFLLVSYVATTVLYICCRESNEGGLLPYQNNPEKFALVH